MKGQLLNFHSNREKVNCTKPVRIYTKILSSVNLLKIGTHACAAEDKNREQNKFHATRDIDPNTRNREHRLKSTWYTYRAAVLGFRGEEYRHPDSARYSYRFGVFHKIRQDLSATHNTRDPQAPWPEGESEINYTPHRE